MYGMGWIFWTVTHKKGLGIDPQLISVQNCAESLAFMVLSVLFAYSLIT